MENDRMTPERAAEARLASLERRMAQLEIWTGVDTDGGETVAEASVHEKLMAQEMVITHLLQHLEYLSPAFSIEKLLEGIRMSFDKAKLLSADRTDFTLDEMGAGQERLLEIIVDLLPARQVGHPTNRFRPTLVPKAPGTEPQS